MAQRTDRGCVHNRDLGFNYPCIDCDPTPDDPKLHSLGWTYGGGRDAFHGDFGTLREQEREIIANAKRRNDTPPEYVGPRSKMRPYAELASE